ncbi:MAG TPA: hypothetical protein VEP90_16020 [Methylomirabilota bacterium]|nr:hypothetical protein [Methylomirabilota bacterium]
MDKEQSAKDFEIMFKDKLKGRKDMENLKEYLEKETETDGKETELVLKHLH